MILRVVSVFDKAAAAYNRPYFVPSLGLAIRSFEDEVKRADPDNPLHNHSSDFELWHIADFDDSIGRFISLDSAFLICTGAQVSAAKA